MRFVKQIDGGDLRKKKREDDDEERFRSLGSKKNLKKVDEDLRKKKREFGEIHFFFNSCFFKSNKIKLGLKKI